MECFTKIGNDLKRFFRKTLLLRCLALKKPLILVGTAARIFVSLSAVCVVRTKLFTYNEVGRSQTQSILNDQFQASRKSSMTNLTIKSHDTINLQATLKIEFFIVFLLFSLSYPPDHMI